MSQRGGDIQYFYERGKALNQTGLAPIFNYPNQQFKMYGVGDTFYPIWDRLKIWLGEPKNVIFYGVIAVGVILLYYMFKKFK